MTKENVPKPATAVGRVRTMLPLPRNTSRAMTSPNMDDMVEVVKDTTRHALDHLPVDSDANAPESDMRMNKPKSS